MDGQDSVSKVESDKSKDSKAGEQIVEKTRQEG